MRIIGKQLRQIIREELMRTSNRLNEGIERKDSEIIRDLVKSKEADFGMVGYQVARNAYEDVLDEMNRMGIGGPAAYKLLMNEIVQIVDPDGRDPIGTGIHLVRTLRVPTAAALDVIPGLEDMLYDSIESGETMDAIASMFSNDEEPREKILELLDLLAIEPQLAAEIANDIIDGNQSHSKYVQGEQSFDPGIDYVSIAEWFIERKKNHLPVVPGKEAGMEIIDWGNVKEELKKIKRAIIKNSGEPGEIGYEQSRDMAMSEIKLKIQEIMGDIEPEMVERDLSDLARSVIKQAIVA